MSTRNPEAYRRQALYQLKKDQDPNWSWSRPVEEARQLLEAQKRKHGLSNRALATAAGISKKTLWAINTGAVARVYPDTIRKILTLPNLAEPYYVPSKATRLRVEALATRGWGYRALANEVAEISISRNSQVTFTRALQVVEFLQGRGSEPGPNAHGAKVALGKGWLPPEAYDRDLFYDPHWDGVGGVLPKAGRAERREDALFLHAHGVPAEEICARLKVSAEWLRKELRVSPAR